MATRTSPFLGMLVASALLVVPTGATPFPGCSGGTLQGCPGVQNCTVQYITQNIDHFSWAPPLGNGRHQTFKQRYYIYDAFWSKPENGPYGPVFFYFGNEDDVGLYVNHTGLMWENAQEFGALLVFAEHRYYGDSLPFNDGTANCLNFLTTEQAMADFAYLIDHIRNTMGAQQSPFIGFGGSYGGMIAAWFRVHYPNAIDGVIAASAPIWSFEGLNPPYDYNSFAKGVTFDASYDGGANDDCWHNLKSAWPKIIAASQTDDGRRMLSEKFRTCHPVRPEGKGDNDGQAIVDWASEPWAYMAMGNYPYKSSYLMHGLSTLQAWPVRKACTMLFGSFASDGDLFDAVVSAVSMYYNNTYDQKCYNITGQTGSNASGGPSRRSPALRRYFNSPISIDTRSKDGSGAVSCSGSWGYQWCTEMVQPLIQGLDDDLYYCPDGEKCANFDIVKAAVDCMETWGVKPRPEWASVILGGNRIQGATNILFSNGMQDPWHGGGVLQNVSDSVVAITIPCGAHHIDLMFSDPGDSQCPDIQTARDFELAHIAQWIADAKERYAALADANTDL